MRTFHRLIGLLAVGLRAITPDVPKLPAVVRFNEHPFAKRCYGKVIAGGHSITTTVVTLLRGILGVLTPRRLAFAAVLLLLFTLGPDAGDGALLADTMVLLPREIQKKKADHDKILGEALKLQEDYKGKPMPQNVGEEYEAKTKEAEALWEEIEPHFESAETRVEQEKRNTERHNRVRALEEAGKIVADPTMPDPDPESNSKVAGYIAFSDYVVASKAFQDAAAGNFRAAVQLGEIPVGLAFGSKSGHCGPNGEPMIPLTREQRKAVEDVLNTAMEEKSLVSIGAGVIEPQRLSVEPKVTADDRIRMRDVIPIGQMSSSSVSYLREESFTRSAAETTPGNAKPEGALSYTEQTATARTIPAWIPVTTDQLADWPALRGRIDNRLLYDVRKREAEQLAYGDGVAPNLEGVLTVSGTNDIAAHALYDASVDLLEKVRLGIMIVARSGYEANALIVDPIDWFQMVVLKGTDDHYLGQVFMTADRQPRVWGVSVVEDVVLEATAGNPTEARNLIVADFLRGCELLDRMNASVQIGLNSDDFTKNRRTLLVEERVAFPIYAPAAFAFLETQALAT